MWRGGSLLLALVLSLSLRLSSAWLAHSRSVHADHSFFAAAPSPTPPRCLSPRSRTLAKPLRPAGFRVPPPQLVDRQESEKRVFGVSVKWLVLALLVCQNALTTILVRHTRRPPPPGAVLYLGSACVLLSELLKLPTCLALIARDEGGILKMLDVVKRTVFVKYKDTLRMGIPALCYGLQNALYFVALSNLSATSYQLWSQTKTLFTALFFVQILGAQLRARQWASLGLLTLGVGVVQLEDARLVGSAPMRPSNGAIRSIGEGVRPIEPHSIADRMRDMVGGGAVVGVLAVISSSILSGFANVYFEKLLKEAECERDDSCETNPDANKPMSLWLRNVQLAVFSIPQATLLMVCNARSREVIATHGLLAGFTPAVGLVAVLTAFGGLLIAAVVKYADNVLKTYATAMSILVICAVTTITTRVLPSARFLLGMMMVVFSMLLYNGAVSLSMLTGRISRDFRVRDRWPDETE